MRGSTPPGAGRTPGERLPGEEHGAQGRRRGPVGEPAVAEHQHQRRGHGVPDGHALAVDEVHEQVGREGVPLGDQRDRGPALKAVYRSRTDRSKVSEAWLAKRSPGPASSSPRAHSTKARAPAWLTVTPLGLPVDPEV